MLLVAGMSMLFADVHRPQKEDIVITLSGELASENSTFIDAPENWNLEYKILFLPEEGKWVEKGDTVVVFDKKEIEQQLDEVLQSFEQLEKSLEEKTLSNEQTIIEIKNQIKILKIQKNIVLNQLEQSKYNSDADQKDAELELKKVELNIKKTQQSLKSQKILNRNSENETILQIEQYKNRIEDYRKMLKDMVITAPKAGIVVYHKTGRRGRGEKVKIGDSVRPASTILQIPDLNNMIVRIDLNEVDISKVEIGQPATISVLAYPDSLFTGHVKFISKIADESENSKLRIYPMDIKIDSNKNFRMKPGLTVKADLTLNAIDDSFAVPSWCLFRDGEGYYVQAGSQSIDVKVIKIYDGKAYVSGPLDTDMQLLENKHIPNF